MKRYQYVVAATCLLLSAVGFIGLYATNQTKEEPGKNQNIVEESEDIIIGSNIFDSEEDQQAVLKSGNYAFAGRKMKKRDFRSLWITRISAQAKVCGMNYSTLMHGLKLCGIDLNRKMLAELAVSDKDAFAAICEKAKAAL